MTQEWQQMLHLNKKQLEGLVLIDFRGNLVWVLA